MICFDSANPDALEAALAIYSGKALINSTTAEDRMLDAVLPVAAIIDPTVPEIRSMLLACDLLMGRDEFAGRWIKHFRHMQKAAATKVEA